MAKKNYVYLLSTVACQTPHERRFRTLEEVHTHLEFWSLTEGWGWKTKPKAVDLDTVYYREAEDDLRGEYVSHTLEKVKR
jgi:hypothetical protein